MNKKKFKKILFFSFIFLVGFFVFLNPADAAKKTFGEKCKTDADCKYGGECTTRCNTGIEEFDKKCPQGEKGKKYCTCKKNSKGQINNFSCAKAYDKPENNKNWKCILKVNQKKDKGLPYCLNKKNNNKYFPITGKDKDTDEEKKQRIIDEKEIMSPGPEIDIPGLDFTGSSSLPMVNGPGGKYIVIPYIGEYISAVYDWSMIAASTLAVLVIIVSGMQWMFPGANIVTKGSGDQKQQINQAKSRILKAISGLLLIASSYVILFTINPELVEFDNLKVKFIERETLSIGHEEPSKSEKTAISGSNITERTPRLDNPSDYCFPLAKDSFKKNLNNWGDDRSGGDRCHAGIDLLTNDDQKNGEVVAIADGSVTVIGRSWLKCSDGATVPKGEKKQTGNIMVYHPELDMTVNYTEVDADKINVENGQEIKKGQKLGRATYCEMLHLELYKGNKWDNIKWHPPDGESSVGNNKCAKKYIDQIPSKDLLNPTGIIEDLSGNYCN